MTKRITRLILCSLVVGLAGSFAYRLIRHSTTVWETKREFNAIAQTESKLNGLYTARRPFSYRWSGAPYGPLPKAESPIPVEDLAEQAARIHRFEVRMGRTTRTRLLTGRIDLLAGDYQQAVTEYRSALLLDPNDPSLELELGIALALRATRENRPLDYESAMELMLRAERQGTGPEATFDLALLCLQVPVFLQGRRRWESVVENDPSSEWRNEAKDRLSSLTVFLEERERRLHEITDSPHSYIAHATEATDSLEVVVSKAVGKWIPELYDSAQVRTAVTTLAEAIETKHRDPWLIELLKLQESTKARRALKSLSESVIANSAGEHIRAFHWASSAEDLFRKLDNRSGVLRSRVEIAYSLHRQFRLQTCAETSRAVREEAHQRHYRWIEGQAWLEEITCLAYQGKEANTKQREAAYRQINETGYTVLGLRALSFLIDPYATFGSRLKIWEHGCDGLKGFWNSLSPGLRAEQFYVGLALAAWDAGDRQAALMLLREGTLTLQDAQYRQLLASSLADLGAWESEAGLPKEAVHTFEEMEELFDQLNAREAHSFRLEAEVARAQAEIASSRVTEAVARLRDLTSGMRFPYTNLVASVRTKLIPTFGDALLAEGRLRDAWRYYLEATSTNFSGSSKIQSSAQKQNVQHLEAAWRGLTNVELRLAEPQKALDTWEQFRSSHSATPVKGMFKPPAGITFLAYAFLPEGLSAWLLDNHGIEQRWIGSKSIGSDAEQFSRLTADPDSPMSSVSHSARLLYAALIAPFEARLPSRGTIIVDPDGPLASIPWMALEDPAGHALVERFGIAQVAGWSEVKATLKDPTVNTDNGLIFADPTLGRELWDQYPPLIDAVVEAQRLRAQLVHASYLHGPEATLHALLQSLPSAATFHFAGHGVSYGGFGALLLAESKQDGVPSQLATADEIMQLDLSRLQLVVLAACSSGEGEQSGVVSVDSLVRAFLQAKTRTVVASRWAVRSEATSDLMAHFYDGIISGQIPVEALRNAAATIRKSFAHPFLWASFQVFGTP